MQTANILLGIGGGRDNIVPKYGVTAAEIAILRAIHGDDAVFDVEPGPDKTISNRAELGRLHEVYGGAVGANGEKIVSVLYPGAAARVFENLEELDIPEDFFKPKTREKAKPKSEGKDVTKMSTEELKAHAATHGIDLGNATKKADVLAKVQAAAAAADDGDMDEDIEDMPAGNGGAVFE